MGSALFISPAECRGALAGAPSKESKTMGLKKYPYYLKSIIELLGNVRPMSTVWQIFLARLTPNSRQNASGYLISLPRQKVKFKVRGVMDIWSVKETFLDRFYERYGTEVGAGWVIVDIGGGIGDFTTFSARAHPSNQVFAFEPTPESFNLLQENLAENHVANAQGFPQAVWSVEGSLWMDTTTGEPGQYVSNSGNQAATEIVAAGGGVNVPSITLAQVFERLAITQCDLLKLDCEGAEYMILFSTPEEALNKIQRVVMEYHDNITEYTHKDLVKFLTNRGFTVKTVRNVVHDYLGYLYAERSVTHT